MKLNWRVRIKNPVFWSTLIPSLIGLIYTILGLFRVIPAISEDVLLNSISTIIMTLTTIGALIDPTTNGVSDSSQAMLYDEPKK